MSTDPRAGESGQRSGISRRTVVKSALGVPVAASSIWMLAACGDDDDSTTGAAATGTATTEGEPRRGGQLRMAVNTTGESDSFNPAIANSPSDAVRLYAAFDPMVRIAPGFKTEPGLVLEWNANDDNTAYELKLREGVVWHDGKPFTADDVIYTLRQLGSASHFGHSAVNNVDLNGLKKLNDTLLSVPLKSPDGRLQDQFIYFNSAMVVQDGAKDFSKPIGTGPFKVTSFTPGQRADLEANRDYWDEGKPYVDALQIISIADDDARMNAVLGGQADLASPMAFPLAKANENNDQVQLLQAEGGPSQCIYMRVDRAPFNDVRVRQALKLLVDRQAMIDTALSGYGSVSNDIAGVKGMADYTEALEQREQDIEQAKSLLSQAGQSDLRITLQTAPVAAGIVEASEVYAQQAKEAGVTVTVKKEQPSAYFNPTLLYGKMAFAQDTWPTPSLASFYTQALVPDSGLNETHWDDPEAYAALQKAIGLPEGDERQQAWDDVQRTQHEEGGYIVWATRHSVDVLSPKVKGAQAGWVYAGNDQRTWQLWLEA